MPLFAKRWINQHDLWFVTVWPAPLTSRLSTHRSVFSSSRGNVSRRAGEEDKGYRGHWERLLCSSGFQIISGWHQGTSLPLSLSILFAFHLSYIDILLFDFFLPSYFPFVCKWNDCHYISFGLWHLSAWARALEKHPAAGGPSVSPQRALLKSIHIHRSNYITNKCSQISVVWDKRWQLKWARMIDCTRRTGRLSRADLRSLCTDFSDALGTDARPALNITTFISEWCTNSSIDGAKKAYTEDILWTHTNT